MRPTVPLEFSRAWLSKAAHVRRRRAELAAAGKLDGMTPEALAEVGAALTGVLRVPVIPIVYAGTDPPFDYRMLAQRLFGGAQGDTLSYLEYWREVSGGLLEVTGAVSPWITMPEEASYYLPEDEYGWARFGRIVEFREQAVRAADRVLDFGRFDNDGPDGMPNSGDDDGFVDFAAMMYALPCDADWRAGAIWPHRGAMPPFETDDASANGGRIKFTDYVILPAIEPGTCTPLHIGVLAHETGHALGLPDLYDYDGSSRGIGAWGLMGMGAHSARWSPAHLSAWAKEQLGWVRVEWLHGEIGEIEIPPVEREPVVFRYDLPGRLGEYLLLENRQHIGSDAHLPGTGLLVWWINPDRAELGSWNGDEQRRAVGLVEADGRADLARGAAADEGDPFPGKTGRRGLELGASVPFRLSSIEEHDQVISANIALGFDAPVLIPEPGVVRLAAPQDGAAVEQVVRVRPEGGAPRAWTSLGASSDWLEVFEREGELVVRADPTGLAPGEYEATIELAPVVTAGWPAQPRTSGTEATVPGAEPPSRTGAPRSQPPSAVGGGLLGHPVSDPGAASQTVTPTDRPSSVPGAGVIGRPTGAAVATASSAPVDNTGRLEAGYALLGVPVTPQKTSASTPEWSRDGRTRVAGTPSTRPPRLNERLADLPMKAARLPRAGLGAARTERAEASMDAVAARASADAASAKARAGNGLIGIPVAGSAAGMTTGGQAATLLGHTDAIGRVAVHFSVAAPAVPQIIATGLPWSWGLAARGGRLYQAGYGWDPLALRPRPRLLSLRDGQRHASTLARLPADALYAPATAGGGAYVLARARGENYLYHVDADGSAAVVAARLGDAPAYGLALTPRGDLLVADWNGRIRRVAPDGAVTPWGTVGGHTYQIAVDEAGTLFAATYRGNVVRIDRNGGRTLLTTGFGPGRLVSIAVTASGAVFAAERGGDGRVIRISPDGSRKLVTRIEGAEFYGLALDRGFLYALDLGHRQLLRIAVGPRDTPAAVAVR